MKDSDNAELRELGIEPIEIDWKLARYAGSLNQNKISFADCFAAALAKKHNGDLNYQR